MTLALVRVAAVAHLLFGGPHLLYHATHLAMFAPGDQIGIVVSLTVPVIAAVVVLVCAGRRPRSGPVAPSSAVTSVPSPV
jgi:hypothetical protein